MNFTDIELIEALKPLKQNIRSKKYFSICINSKNCKNGSVFFALKGEKTDGHNYIKDAFDNGAFLAITEKEVDFPYLMVKNSKEAILQLLDYYLKKLNLKKVSITGSVGKTTTRFFLNSLLNDLAVTTPKNYNTEISIPLILNYVNNETRYLIFEFGLQQKGDIRLLASVVKPNISIITKVSNVHLKYFNNLSEIIKEKISILDYTSDYAVVDKSLKNSTNFPNLEFVDYDKIYDKPYVDLKLEYNNIPKRIELKNIPNFFTPNLLSALKVCERLKIPFDILNFDLHVPDNRFEIKNLKGIKVIADYYNSNPYSLKKALSYLKFFKGRKIVVLGDMLELGKDEIKEHKKMAGILNDFDIVILYGKLIKFADKGYNYFDEKDKAIDFLIKNIKKDDVVFIKGSRSMKMEDFEEAIKCR